MKKRLLKIAAVAAVSAAFVIGGSSAASADADFSNVWGCTRTTGEDYYYCSDNGGNSWYTDRPDWNPFWNIM
ncbi:hypothetical protein [Microbacterium sp. PMB16]|uniref:hypothetical protein n=1 Tax=Microbacterium sp. PMB16 TaxID=3120157 RepID=UPI003F4C8B8D